MIEIKLKPCPFCGGKASLNDNSTFSCSSNKETKLGYSFFICFISSDIFLYYLSLQHF